MTLHILDKWTLNPSRYAIQCAGCGATSTVEGFATPKEAEVHARSSGWYLDTSFGDDYCTVCMDALDKAYSTKRSFN